MRVIFLGCGYLGYNLANLLSSHFEVEVWGIESAYSSKCAYFKQVDVFSDDLKKQDLEGAIVVDTLGLVQNNQVVENEDEALDALEMRYRSLLETLLEKGMARYFFISSGGTIYGNHTTPVKEDEVIQPVSFYAKSKARIEALIQKLEMNYVILRLSNPFGGYQEAYKQQGVVPILIRAALEEKPFTMWIEEESVRDYCYIDDVASALALLIDQPVNQEIVNVGSGIPTSLKHAIKTVEEMTGKDITVIRKKSEAPVISSIVLDIDKLKTLTGFEVKVSFEEGVKREVERIRKGEEV